MKSPVAKLSESGEISLDIIRFAAALMVAIGHFTAPFFSSNLPDLITPASGAVAVFFVLSGFVIRYVTRMRPYTVGDFSIDRASRMYSVVLPALAFTFIANNMAKHLSPQFYNTYWWAPPTHPLLCWFGSATFTSQVWFQDLTPPSNSPFWSLGYEVPYYALYGIAFYLRGWRRGILLTLALLLSGPAILFLAPVWPAGCWMHDFYQIARRSQKANLLAIALIVAPVLLLVSIHFLPVAHHGFEMLRDRVRAVNHYLGETQLQRANSLWYYEVGIPTTIGMLCILLLLDKVRINGKPKWAKWIRFTAEGTFPLYLFHFPMYLLIAALFPNSHGNRIYQVVTFTGVLFACILLGAPCNKLKLAMRAGLHLSRARTQTPV